MFKFSAYILLITYFSTIANYSFANSSNKFKEEAANANDFAAELLNKSSNTNIDANGNISWNGEVLFSSSSAVGQKDNDYVPASIDTVGDDVATINAGKQAHSIYAEAKNKTNLNSGERAYQIMKKSFETQKPNLSNDPFWENTDHILNNLPEIAKDFASCSIKTELVSIGKNYHVPKYKTCEKLPALEEHFVIGHDYSVAAILRHNSGAVNLAACGLGCMKMWIGTKQDDHWSGWCSIYEENMSVKVLRPDNITFARLSQSVFDDYHQVYLNNIKVYNAPNSLFPPETSGECELSTSWITYPNINITNNFREVEPNGILEFKTRTSVSGKGEGYSQIDIFYDASDIITNEVWNDTEAINKAFEVKKQIEDGFCTGEITCTNMPILDSNKCRTENGIYVCEDNFKTNPVAGLGISPFCKKIEVKSNCEFNKGELCWKNTKDETVCFDNTTVDKNTCRKYEEDTNCSYVKSECLEGGNSGKCYVQEDTFDCGFTASTGTLVENEVLKCDGQIQCIGEDCYSPKRDQPNEDLLAAHASLEILKHAQADMSCLNLPDQPFNAERPPDEYFPVPTCPEGFSFDATNNECYQKISCEFDANNFYAASARKGIQAVYNEEILAQNTEIRNCTPLSQPSGITYTCGNTMKQEATDTFYEICSNKVAEVLPKGCPSLTHVVNAKNGLCQIPATPSCEEGYELVQGADLFVPDDFCKKICTAEGQPCDDPKSDNLAANYDCPSSYPVLNDSEFRCEIASFNPITHLNLKKELQSTNTSGKVKKTEYDSSENVSCQLFDGNSATCKLAIGGMKNCCEAPTLPNLGDYIDLVTTMLHVDALTAKLEFIEGYSGAWNTIKTGVSEGWSAIQSTETYQAVESGVSTAWGTVKGVFSTPVDTVATKGAEAATTVSMESLKQGIMKQMNQFLVDKFGSDIASMFFTSTVDQATQEVTISASENLAAAGQVMAYIYYAYLAYVIFTLLVDIVYECSEEELNLSMKHELLSTHYIGSYCRNNDLGVCIEKRNTYCVFSSPFSRIMMEQIYMQPQMGLSWGTPEQPNCEGLEFEDIEKVDFSKINLDEWIGILIETNNIKTLSGNLNMETLTGNGSFLDKVGEDRDNALERNQKKLLDTEADDIRRTAYEEAWNAKQTAN